MKKVIFLAYKAHNHHTENHQNKVLEGVSRKREKG